MTPDQANQLREVLIAFENLLDSVIHRPDDENRWVIREKLIDEVDEYISALELDHA